MTDRLRAAAQAALDALEWAWGGEPLSSKEHEAITLLRAALAEPYADKAKQFSGTQLRIDPVTGNVGIGTVALAEPTCKDDLQDAEPDEIGPEWTPCVKRPVTVHVREQRVGEAHVSTREGITPVKPDDLIMRGVDGEEYPIGRDLFNRTYVVGVELSEPEVEQKPAAWIREDTAITTDAYQAACWRDSHTVTPLYTAPPRREWVGLTDEEIDRVTDAQWARGNNKPIYAAHRAYARAIEAALKEKNRD